MDHAYQPVPREERLCRLCKQDIENPEHALVTFTSSNALVELRDTFLAQLFLSSPDLQRCMAEYSNTEFLKAMIYSRRNIALVAKYAYNVLEIFYAIPVYRLSDDA